MATESQSEDPWFQLKIEGTTARGVDIKKLAQVLDSMSTAFYAIARSKLGIDSTRPGPHTPKEDALAAVRVTHIRPGSLIIEAEPPAVLSQPELPFFENPTPDDVAYALYTELMRTQASAKSPAPSRVRRAVRDLVQQVSEIGSSAEVVYRPTRPLPEEPEAEVMRTRIERLDAQVVEAGSNSTRRRRLTGHAYMVDLEPGRPRVRVKLTDGRDVTLDVSEEQIERVPQVLDRAVEVEAEELYEDEAAIRRTAVNIKVLPGAGDGSDLPPKSIAELAAEQGMPDARPDYQSLASSVWETKEEVDEFVSQIHDLRESA